MTQRDAVRRAFERRLASYVGLGWMVVERQEDPPRARLVYDARGRRQRQESTIRRDSGERIVWVDAQGEIQVDQVGKHSPQSGPAGDDRGPR
jgi:hypothetical protein